MADPTRHAASERTPELPVLAGAGVTLRPPIDADAGARLAHGNDAVELAGYGMTPADLPPMDRERAAGWLKEMRVSRSWIIEEAGGLRGSIRLHARNARDRRASLAVGLLSAAYMGRGLGRRAIALVLDHAFGTLDLHRISLRVLSENTRAIGCYRALGFVEEGRQREAALTSDGWKDDIMMGLLARDWRGLP